MKEGVLGILEMPPVTEPDNIDVVRASIANRVDFLWTREKTQGRGTDFLKVLADPALLIGADNPAYLYANGRLVIDKMQPSAIESVHETAKRLLFVEKLKSNLPDQASGLLCGGSLSYGRFYNIRGGSNPSDLDLFLTVDPGFFSYVQFSQVINQENGFSAEACRDFEKRAPIFQRLFKSGKADLMSVKTPVDNFLASIKVIPTEIFIDEFDTGFSDFLVQDRDCEKMIRDYKQGHYTTPAFVQYNFLHQPLRVDLPQEYPDEGGSIVTIPYMHIINGHLYTGQHHNHLIPRFEYEYDRDGTIENTVSRFRSHLEGRFGIEKARAGDAGEELALINITDRKDIFSPFIRVSPN